MGRNVNKYFRWSKLKGQQVLWESLKPLGFSNQRPLTQIWINRQIFGLSESTFQEGSQSHSSLAWPPLCHDRRATVPNLSGTVSDHNGWSGKPGSVPQDRSLCYGVSAGQALFPVPALPTRASTPHQARIRVALPGHRMLLRMAGAPSAV